MNSNKAFGITGISATQKPYITYENFCKIIDTLRTSQSPKTKVRLDAPNNTLLPLYANLSVSKCASCKGGYICHNHQWQSELIVRYNKVITQVLSLKDPYASYTYTGPVTTYKVPKLGKHEVDFYTKLNHNLLDEHLVNKTIDTVYKLTSKELTTTVYAYMANELEYVYKGTKHDLRSSKYHDLLSVLKHLKHLQLINDGPIIPGRREFDNTLSEEHIELIIDDILTAIYYNNSGEYDMIKLQDQLKLEYPALYKSLFVKQLSKPVVRKPKMLNMPYTDVQFVF